MTGKEGNQFYISFIFLNQLSIITNHKKIAERQESHLPLDSGGSSKGEFIRCDS
jgi:hypothetical protein